MENLSAENRAIYDTLSAAAAEQQAAATREIRDLLAQSMDSIRASVTKGVKDMRVYADGIKSTLHQGMEEIRAHVGLATAEEDPQHRAPARDAETGPVGRHGASTTRRPSVTAAGLYIPPPARVANILFLESPAGVGFSHSNTSSENYVSGDRRTAVDAYIFLLNWLERFPEYKGRDFFIAGESYSGHYVPQLASVIIALHKFGLTSMNLKGIFVGNPLLDDYKNDKGWLEFLWNHGVMSDEVWGDISAHCSFRGVEGKACGQAKDSFRTGDIDPYNIYAPVCLVSRNGTLYSSSYLAGYDPCIGAHVSVYFNKPEVQKAIHVRTKTEWSECADLRAWTDAPVSMVPTLDWLVGNGLRVWIYSGDMDDVCPITATRYSVKDLGLAITKPWRPCYTPQSEVGGYTQQYEGGFTFASVRGAGHLVPSFQPKRSLVLFYSFLKGVLPPAFPKVNE